jgi:hypothetical protein
VAAASYEHDHLTNVAEKAQYERNEFKKRHDEMFGSVSTLNARIEELEQHKIHLLGKLKNYGDKGGLDYIVKT